MMNPETYMPNSEVGIIGRAKAELENDRTFHTTGIPNQETSILDAPESDFYQRELARIKAEQDANR